MAPPTASWQYLNSLLSKMQPIKYKIRGEKKKLIGTDELAK